MSHKKITIINDNTPQINYIAPHIKVKWRDNPENFTPEKVNRVKAYFQNKYNTQYIKIQTIVVSKTKNTTLESLSVTDNIVNSGVQKKLIRDYISENKIDVDVDLLDRLDNKINTELSNRTADTSKYNKWSVNKIEFSNFLSFGDNNILDFTKLGGITVVESTPKNFGGKTTITIDLLLFLFFNKTTKSKKALDIFNRFTDKDEISVKGYITIDGINYIIERKLSRKLGTSGEYTTNAKLEFHKVNSDGTIENLSGEQRRETETFITSVIGSEEDFLSTILTTGYNLEELIEAKPTARGQILTKFIGLEIFKNKEEICKEFYNEWSKKRMANSYNLSGLISDNKKFADNISISKNEIAKLNKQYELSTIKIKQIESKKDEILKKRNNDIDQELIKINPQTLKNEISDLQDKQNKVKVKAASVNVTEPKEFYSGENHDKVTKQVTELLIEIKLLENKILTDRETLRQIDENKDCPLCNRPLDVCEDTPDKKLAINNQIDADVNKLDRLNKNLEELKITEKSFIDLKQQFDTYEKNKVIKDKYEIETKQYEFDIRDLQTKLNTYESNKIKLEENKKIDIELIGTKTQYETISSEINYTRTRIEKMNNEVSLLEEKIKNNNTIIEKIKVEDSFEYIYKTYLSLFGKNGISKVILSNMVPLVNEKLSKLLEDTCQFILELDVNDKDEIEFNMIDVETRIRKPLVSGSGYEKTVSSLALRSVLTDISTLPKPNVIVMDEIFGKIADDNIELVGEFFKKIKSYFEHIILISHNPLVRNWSDNLIMIKKDDNISTIDFVNSLKK